MSRKKINTENKEKIKELKSDLFWYNILLGVSGLATVLKISWMIVKYKEMPMGQMVWKLAIILTASLSFLIYYFIGRRKIVRELEKLKSIRKKTWIKLLLNFNPLPLSVLLHSILHYFERRAKN